MKNAKRDAVIYIGTNGGMSVTARIIRNDPLFGSVGDIGSCNWRLCNVQAMPDEIPGCAKKTDRPAQVI